MTVVSKVPARKSCEPLVKANGALERESGWIGPYEIYTNNCHHAANAGLSQWRDVMGVLKCSETEYYLGHAANYSIGPCPSGDAKCTSICATEPQKGIDGDPCCWEQTTGEAVNVTTGEGESCAKVKCGLEAYGKQSVLPLGKLYAGDGPSNCALRMFRSKSPSFNVTDVLRTQCKTCCGEQTDRWKDHKEYEATRIAFDKECRNLCDNMGRTR